MKGSWFSSLFILLFPWITGQPWHDVRIFPGRLWLSLRAEKFSAIDHISGHNQISAVSIEAHHFLPTFNNYAERDSSQKRKRRQFLHSSFNRLEYNEATRHVAFWIRGVNLAFFSQQEILAFQLCNPVSGSLIITHPTYMYWVLCRGVEFLPIFWKSSKVSVND